MIINLMAQFITDIRHLAPSDEHIDLPDGAWQFRDYLGRIISAGTIRPAMPQFISGIPCRAKIDRKKCQGTLAISRQDLPISVINWQCTECDEGGQISGWRDHLYDCGKRSEYTPAPGEKYLSILLSMDEFRALLASENIFDLDSDKIILSGQKIAQSVQISGWEGEMDYFIGYVASSGNHTKNKKLEKHLDSVFLKIQKELDNCFETSVLR